MAPVTELQARGLRSANSRRHPSHPDVAVVAAAYVAAGSQTILTNTFGANRLRLAARSAERVAEANRRGVEISRQAASLAYVFASLGPSGKLLMTGEISPEELQAAFDEQAAALAEAGADAIVVESMADLEEAKLAIKAAQATGLPVVVCMVFDSGKNKDRTMMGTTPEQVAQELTAAGADVIGANCGQGMAGFVPICRRLRNATACPIWIKPNAGLPQLVEGRTVYQTTAEEFAGHIPDLIAAGANFVGGCCGASAEFIKALKLKIESKP